MNIRTSDDEHGIRNWPVMAPEGRFHVFQWLPSSAAVKEKKKKTESLHERKPRKEWVRLVDATHHYHRHFQ
jgi:hypothetical protein